MGRLMRMKVTSHVDEITPELEAKLLVVMDAIGQDAASTAAAKAPYKTGALRNSISRAVNHPSKDIYQTVIGTNLKSKLGAPYPLYQEEGTSRIAGKHYLRFGIQAHRFQYRDMIENELKG